MCKESKENLGKVRKVIPTIDNSGEYRMCMESKEKLGKVRKVIPNTHRALHP